MIATRGDRCGDMRGKIGKRQWHLGHAIAVVAVAGLALLTMPACSYLFALQQSKVPSVVEPIEGATAPPTAAGVDAEQPAAVDDWNWYVLIAQFPYRTIGGVMFYKGGLAKVRPDYGPPVPAADSALLQPYVAAATAGPEVAVTPEDCIGRGDDRDPIVVRNLTDFGMEVAAGIACARWRFPNSAWVASVLQISDQRALSAVLLRREDGLLQLFDTDVTRFVALQRARMR
jgi:hypothetical protein